MAINQLVRRSKENFDERAVELSDSNRSAFEAIDSTSRALSVIYSFHPPNSTLLLFNVKFGKNVTLFEIVFNNATAFFGGFSAKKQVKSEVILREPKLALNGSFVASKRTVCVEHASFSAGTAPGQSFALTHQLVSYCGIRYVDSTNKSIMFPPKSNLKVNLTAFGNCPLVNDPVVVVDCYCNSLSSDGLKQATNPATSSGASTLNNFTHLLTAFFHLLFITFL